MKALIPDKIYRRYLTLFGYFRLFPIKKKVNGEYLCDLIHEDYNGNEERMQWSIPKEYIEDENGVVSYSRKDVYFGRWTLKTDYVEVIKEDGTHDMKMVYRPSVLIGFWNTSLFKYKMDLFR